MEIAPQPSLKFLGVNIINIQFNVLKNISSNEVFDLTVDPKVYIPADRDDAFSIVMTIQLKFKDEYNLSINAVGNFIVENDTTAERRKHFINSNAPAIMFPYMRAFISTLTSNTGTMASPIIIPPHFFKGDLEEIKIPQPQE